MLIDSTGQPVETSTIPIFNHHQITDETKRAELQRDAERDAAGWRPELESIPAPTPRRKNVITLSPLEMQVLQNAYAKGTCTPYTETDNESKRGAIYNAVRVLVGRKLLQLDASTKKSKQNKIIKTYRITERGKNNLLELKG